jgi:cation:H+ antiporter
MDAILEAPAWVLIAAFLLGAATVWSAGTRLAHRAKEIGAHTGLSDAFLGAVLLASATELPELTTAVTATTLGADALAMGNLLGGIPFQTTMLVVADATMGRGALTYFAPNVGVVLHGLMLVGLLTLLLVAIQTGDASLGPVGVWSVVLLVAYGSTLLLIRRHTPAWRPLVGNGDTEEAHEPGRPAGTGAAPLSRTVRAIAGASLLVNNSGRLVTFCAEALVARYALSAGPAGATLLALSTSLPELSTTIAAARSGACTLAFANIFGSNAIMLALIFVADVASGPGPLLVAGGRTAVLCCLAGILGTTAYLVGIVERRNASWLRLGADSWAVLGIQVALIVALFAGDGA